MSAPEEQSSHGAAAGATALIVDDEPLVAMHLADIVEDAGWTAIGPASSGREAMQLAAHNRPELALIDVNIAGDQDGVALAAALSERFDTLIVLISGYADLAAEERVRALRPFAVLAKPCSPDEVERILRSAAHHTKKHGETR